MSRKRRSFGALFKAKVALAAVRGDKTTAELAAKFGVHGNQVSSWKKQLLMGAPELFADGPRPQAEKVVRRDDGSPADGKRHGGGQQERRRNSIDDNPLASARDLSPNYS